MKSLQKTLRIWIATASLAGFLGGWGLLANSPKPAPIESNPPPVVTPLPTLQPLPPINSGNSSQLQPLPPMPQVRSFSPSPFLRTGGS